jgi:hypothetical protein
MKAGSRSATKKIAVRVKNVRAKATHPPDHYMTQLYQK